jgi:hypothetical protein
MLIAQVTVTYPPDTNPNRDPGAIAAPVGWALIRGDAISGQVYQWLYFHRYGSGDPTSWTWEFSNSSLDYYPGAAILAVSGASDAPIDAIATLTGQPFTSMVAPSVTPRYSNDLYLMFSIDANGWDSLSNPADLSILTNGNGTVDGDRKLMSADPTESSFSVGGSGYWVGAALVIH